MATQVSDTGGKSRARGSSSDELAVIAQRAQAFTNASGAAIALSEGNAAEIICRARSGSSSPEVGTIMRVEGSFTGLCIQSGKELRCDDAESDTRVDTTGLRALGIRSMVVTPIKEENRVVGILAVFAPTAHAFTITHVAVLKTMADQISALLQKERRAREEGILPEPVRPPAPVSMPKPVAAVPAPVLPPPVVIKPATPSSTATARATFPVVSKVEPIKTAPIAEEVMAPTPFPKREERRAEHKIEYRANLGTFDAVAGEEKKSGSRMIIIGVAGVVLVAAVSTFGYLKMRKPTSSSAQVQQHVQETPSPSATAQPAAPGLVAANNPQPSPAATGNQPATTSAPTTTVNVPAAKPSTASTPADSAKRPVDRTPVRNNTPAPPEKRAPETVALSTGASKIVPTSNAGQQSPDAAPILTVGSTSVPGALTALAQPAASSKPRGISQSDLEPMQVVKSVKPLYPDIAKARRITGIVVVAGMVGTDGKIKNLRLVSGPPVLGDAVFEALKKYEFKPARLNGQPIEQPYQIQINFGNELRR